MVKMSVAYTGEKHCVLTHEPSGSIIETDAPVDNKGKGERFSPTDLVGAALGSCILTTIAIAAERDGIAFSSGKVEIEKTMQTQPRKIAQLCAKVSLPKSLKQDQRKTLESVAINCPVSKSLSQGLQADFEFDYV